MMQRLDLDFRATRRGSPWLGRVLLLAAAFVMVDSGVSYQKANQALRESETRLARRTPAGSAPAVVSKEEVAAVRETVERIGLPWDSLFSALEAAATDKVALVSIEPDPKKGTVTIAADGKDYLAALSYVSNLGRAESLSGVQLVRHEHKADAKGLVTFSVSAGWSAQ